MASFKMQGMIIILTIIMAISCKQAWLSVHTFKHIVYIVPFIMPCAHVALFGGSDLQLHLEAVIGPKLHKML